jgi:hypothetical protein
LNPKSLPPIQLLAHADWGIGRHKRWLTKACLSPDRRYKVSIPELVEDPNRLIPNLDAEHGPDEVYLLGFDFPIGLPLTYACKAGIQDFHQALIHFGTGKWADFYHPAILPGEIQIERPFYPLKPGQSKQVHLLDALGVPKIDDLRRLCEKGYSFSDSNGLHHRRPASPLFWTMGGQQVGKAAILGWEKAIAPALLNPSIALSIWPFDGEFRDLIHQTGIITVESYPAEYYQRLGICFQRGRNGGGKRSQPARMVNAQAILDWCATKDIDLEPALIAWIYAGFGASLDGEDPFDSLVGLLGMISCLRDPSWIYEPLETPIRQIEGWIFGMPGALT